MVGDLDDVYSDEVETEDDEDEGLDFGSQTKFPRKRNKQLISSLDPIENFKAYPGRPGYSGPLSSVFEGLV